MRQGLAKMKHGLFDSLQYYTLLLEELMVKERTKSFSVFVQNTFYNN